MEITVNVFPALRPCLKPEWTVQAEIKLRLQDLPSETKSVRNPIRCLRLSEKEAGRIIASGTIKWDKAIERYPGDRIIRSIFIGGG